MKRPSQYLRARGRAGRGHRPGAGRCARGHCKRRRGGPGGASAAAIRQAGGVIGPAIRPKAGRARRHRAGAARRRAVLAALGLAVCRRCSMARRSAVCWHRAGGRRGAGRCRWCAAGAGCCRRCSVSGPAKRAKEKGRGGGALCVGRPGLFCCCCRPGAGLFLLFAEGVRFFT